MSLQNSHQVSDIKVLLVKGADGVGIENIEKTGTVLNVDTYTITLTNGGKYTFDVTNGTSIESIEKTSTVGDVDTYTITLTDESTYTFTVTNAYGSTASDISYDNASSGASATKVQGALDEAFSDISDLSNDVAEKAEKTDLTDINITGSTNNTGSTIKSGKFFYLNGTLVRAKTDIANGATFTENTNYKVITTGALNSLKTLKQIVSSAKPCNSGNNNVDISSYGIKSDNAVFLISSANPAVGSYIFGITDSSFTIYSTALATIWYTIIEFNE